MKYRIDTCLVSFVLLVGCSAGSQNLGSNRSDAGTSEDSKNPSKDAGSPAPSETSHPGSDPSPTPDASSPANGGKRVFITSTTYDGAFGGLEGGDDLCHLAAKAAGVDGTWKAWLSDSTTDAIDRIVDVSPWYLMDRKTKVFANKASLMTTALHGIDQDELGRFQALVTAWTGTDHGRATADTCLGWTTNEFTAPSPVGTTVRAWDWKTSNGSDICSVEHALVCFEQ